MRNPARQARVIVNRWRRDAIEGNWLDQDVDRLDLADAFLAGDHAAPAAEAITGIVEDYYANVVDDSDTGRWPRIYAASREVVGWIDSHRAVILSRSRRERLLAASRKEANAGGDWTSHYVLVGALALLGDAPIDYDALRDLTDLAPDGSDWTAAEAVAASLDFFGL